MSPRLNPALLMLLAVPPLSGCSSMGTQEAEAAAEPLPVTRFEEDESDLILGSAADLIVISDDIDEDLGAFAAPPADPTPGRPSPGASSRVSSRDADDAGGTGVAPSPPRGQSAGLSGPSGPSAVSLSDPGMGRGGGRTISAEQIKEIVRQNSGQVRACYERELKSRPQLQGKLVVAWTIGADGRVRAPRTVLDTTGGDGLSSCVRRSIGEWRFASAESPQDVEYPFVFKPQEY